MSSKEDMTLDRNWCREQADRLAAWEVLRRYVLHLTELPMTNAEPVSYTHLTLPTKRIV